MTNPPKWTQSLGGRYPTYSSDILDGEHLSATPAGRDWFYK